MDKQIIFNKSQCYIISQDNGIQEEEPVTIEAYNKFSDGSTLVQLNNRVFGVLKTNSSNPETSYIDDYEIIKSDIAELFDVDHEETRRIVSDTENIGVFTELNYSKDVETRISATAVFNHLISYANKGLLSEEENSWITEVLNLSKEKTNTTIKDVNSIEKIIEFGFYALVKDIEFQTGKTYDAKSKEALKKNYIRMILFDYIIDRRYRGLDYYLISGLNAQQKPLFLDARFSPISVNSSIDKENSIKIGEYYINNCLIDKEILMDVLFNKYYKDIKKMTEALNDAQRLYKDAISRIIYNNTELEKAVELEDLIFDNLLRINKRQKDKEKSNDKDLKTNKIERTMATQSLNVRVTAKLDLIQKKYPVNPKEHPELIEMRKKKKNKESNEKIKLIVEKEKNKKAGFANVSTIISVISLICGIGIGIAYALLTIGR